MRAAQGAGKPGIADGILCRTTEPQVFAAEPLLLTAEMFQYAFHKARTRPFLPSEACLQSRSWALRGCELDGAKVRLSNDLGSDWSTGYDPSVSAAQKAALDDIIAQLYPFKWTWLKTDTAPFSWNITKTGVATAKRDDRSAEVVLERVKGDKADDQIVRKNLRYWNVQTSGGLRMWKSKTEQYRGHDQKFNYSRTNRFLITIRFTGAAK
jgi:hypothetical protein